MKHTVQTLHIETRKVVSLKAFCQHIGADYYVIVDDISNSDISFGANPDTLLDANTCEEFLFPHGYTMPEGLDDVWFSLGC